MRIPNKSDLTCSKSEKKKLFHLLFMVSSDATLVQNKAVESVGRSSDTSAKFSCHIFPLISSLTLRQLLMERDIPVPE